MALVTVTLLCCNGRRGTIRGITTQPIRLKTINSAASVILGVCLVLSHRSAVGVALKLQNRLTNLHAAEIEFFFSAFECHVFLSIV